MHIFSTNYDRDITDVKNNAKKNFFSVSDFARLYCHLTNNNQYVFVKIYKKKCAYNCKNEKTEK